jgi:hypothetical protein
VCKESARSTSDQSCAKAFLAVLAGAVKARAFRAVGRLAVTILTVGWLLGTIGRLLGAVGRLRGVGLRVGRALLAVGSWRVRGVVRLRRIALLRSSIRLLLRRGICIVWCGGVLSSVVGLLASIRLLRGITTLLIAVEIVI